MLIRRRALIIAPLVLLLAPRPCRSAAPGFTFLNLGASARAASMGDAQVAVVGDAAALYWNPALLTGTEGGEISLTHVEWFQNFRLEAAALAGSTSFAHYGALVTGMYAGQDDLVRRDASGADEGHFGFYDVAAEIGIAREIRPGIAAGIGGKYIVESIDRTSYGTVALDAGVLWTTHVAGLRAGAAVSNVGPTSRSDGIDVDLPLTARAGVGYVHPVPSIGGGVTLAADGESRRGDQSHLHLGAEVLLRRILMLDAGWKSGYDSQAGSFGAGMAAGRAKVHYAYLPTSTGLGTTHRITLRLSF